jgi:hypothetical protein
MVAIEVVLVAGFLATAWHIWQDRQNPPLPAGAAIASTTSTPHPSRSRRSPLPVPTAAPSPGVSAPAAPASGPTPGIRDDPAFTQQQMTQFGRDQSALEKVEWRAIDAVVAWARQYVNEVVLPQIESASNGR